MGREREMVTIPDCEGLKASKGGALLVACARWERDMWIPQSVIGEDAECYEPGTSGDLVIEAWFARKEGLE